MTFKNKLVLVLGAIVAISTLATTSLGATNKTSAKNKNDVILTADNMISINTYYDGQTISNIVQKAKVLDSKLPSNEPLYFVINSGGGSIDAGIELIENLNNLNRPVITLSLWSASMGFQTVQGVKGRRLITTDGTLMSHKARGMFYGEFPGQLDARYSYYLKRVLRLDKRASERTGGKHTLATYRALIENEYWCDGQDCVDQGFADAVVSPKCDVSLNGTHTQLYERFIYMGHVVEIVDTFADCPLQTEALDYQVLIDGEPLFGKPAPEEKTNTVFMNTATIGLSSLGIETAENIKKLILEKIENRKNNIRTVHKY